MNIADRAASAVIGALVGDAGVGLIGTTTSPNCAKIIATGSQGIPRRYHGGMTPGQMSQTGLIIVMLLRSVVGIKGLHETNPSATPDDRVQTWWLPAIYSAVLNRLRKGMRVVTVVP